MANGNSLLPHDRFKNEGGAATPQSVDGWLIVYGITGTHNNVSSSVLDAVYTITNGNMLMQAPINMNRKTIKNLPLPTSASQAASKAYVDGSRISILQHATATFVDAYIKETQSAFILWIGERKMNLSSCLLQRDPFQLFLTNLFPELMQGKTIS